MPSEDLRDYRLAYAAVIDAKYTTSENVWDRLQTIEKYREIRSVDTNNQIARQVWVAAPIPTSLQPRDEAVTWSANGEVGANPFDVILGIIGADPADRDQTGVTLKAFVLGLLEHSQEYARSTKPGKMPHRSANFESMALGLATDPKVSLVQRRFEASAAPSARPFFSYAKTGF